MVYNIDEEMLSGLVFDSLLSAIEDSGIEMSEDTFSNIANAIDDALPGVIEILAMGTEDLWKTEAESIDSGWGKKYAKAIMSSIEGDKAEVYLDPDSIDKSSGKENIMFAMMVEKGVRSWSIKDALMKSDKAKISKDGVRYIVVPFPVAIPRREGQGTMQSKFGKREMTNEIYKLVKSGQSVKGMTIKAGVRDVDISGLSRYTTRQRHSQYGIFRVVTQNSKGWQYPGVSPRPVFDKVKREIDKEVSRVMTEFVTAVVKEHTN